MEKMRLKIHSLEDQTKQSKIQADNFKKQVSYFQNQNFHFNVLIIVGGCNQGSGISS